MGYTLVGFFLIKCGGEIFLDEFSSVWFLLRDCGEVSLERRSVFRMVTISLLYSWLHSLRSSLYLYVSVHSWSCMKRRVVGYVHMEHHFVSK